MPIGCRNILARLGNAALTRATQYLSILNVLTHTYNSYAFVFYVKVKD